MTTFAPAFCRVTRLGPKIGWTVFPDEHLLSHKLFLGCPVLQSQQCKTRDGVWDNHLKNIGPFCLPEFPNYLLRLPNHCARTILKVLYYHFKIHHYLQTTELKCILLAPMSSKIENFRNIISLICIEHSAISGRLQID